MVEDGTFRQDLFFRLNGVILKVPPLRDRVDEIEPLVRLFVSRARKEWDIQAREIAGDAMAALSKYGWPGNVRQLRHAVERAALLCAGGTVGVSDLPEYVFEGARQKKDVPLPVADFDELGLRDHVVKYERALIDEALRRAGGNRRAAAKLLRIPVRTLFRKMRGPGGTEEPES
jgi:two-component system response regulator AtoC